jgi:hypothetical protein
MPKRLKGKLIVKEKANEEVVELNPIILPHVDVERNVKFEEAMLKLSKPLTGLNVILKV